MASKPLPAARTRKAKKTARQPVPAIGTIPAPAALPPRKNPEAKPSLGPARPVAPAKAQVASRPAKSPALRTGVAIVGSLNMDLMVRTEMIPAPGQTVMGQDLLENPGGKGANQAAAVGKLWRSHGGAAGARIIGKIGDDEFGRRILLDLERARVDTAAVQTARRTPTGAAMIFVDRHGENAIVVAAGANRELTATDLLAQRKAIESSAVLLAQLEIPADTVACAIALAKRTGVLTILDPAPVSSEGLPESLYHVDILIPNQSEAALLSGIAVRTPDDARRAAERFLLRGTRTVIVKLGSQGAVIVQRENSGAIGARSPAAPPADADAAAWGAPRTQTQHIPGFRVAVVDTTAAGDAFAGALCVGLAEGMPLARAVRFANAAGALACTKHGALGSMPARAEVDQLIAGASIPVLPK